jgi:hypothetical protein
MGLSNMLSKLFKKENAGASVKIPVKFKDFDSIIIPPEPKTRGIFIYKTLNLGLEFAPITTTQSPPPNAETFRDQEDAVLLTDDSIEEITEED